MNNLQEENYRAAMKTVESQAAKIYRLTAALTKIADDERVPPWVRSVAHSALNRERT